MTPEMSKIVVLNLCGNTEFLGLCAGLVKLRYLAKPAQ